MERLGAELRSQAELEAVTEEALRNAEIEGQVLPRDSVRSSVARRLRVRSLYNVLSLRVREALMVYEESRNSQ